MRLRTTLFGLLVVIAIVLSGTVYAGFALHKGNIETEERQSLNATAETIASSLDTRIEEKRSLVELMASDPDAVVSDDESHHRVVDRFVRRTTFDGASIIDDNGVMQAISARNLSTDRREDLIGSDFSHRTYVRTALEGTTYVGEPFEAESGNYIVVVSAPIEREGSISGVFTGTFHLGRTHFFADIPPSLEPGQRLSIQHENLTIFEHGNTSGDYLTDTRSLETTDWQVSVAADRGTIQRDLWFASLAQLGAVGVALVSIAFVGIWFSRTTLTHLDALIAGLTGLETGRYDQELDLGTTDEWAKIRAQFNSLAETLDQRESQLRVLNRVLRHNLRNDMSVIIAHADTLLHDGDDDDSRPGVQKIRQTAYDLIQTSEHARAIYEDLLSGETAERRPIDLTALVESHVERLRSEYPESRIEYDIPQSAYVTDSDTMPMILDELCRNALVHHDRPEAERELSLDVSMDEGDVYLEVSDDGPGLPEVEAELLTGSREETSIEHGSGLGLWVVNWLVTQLDGEVSVRTGPERGTIVTVRLPEAAEPPDDTESVETEGPADAT